MLIFILIQYICFILIMLKYYFEIVDLNYHLHFDIDCFIHCLFEMRKGSLFRFEYLLIIFIKEEYLIGYVEIFMGKLINIGLNLLFRYVNHFNVWYEINDQLIFQPSSLKSQHIIFQPIIPNFFIITPFVDRKDLLPISLFFYVVSN
jgi:hypothetical protein